MPSLFELDTARPAAPRFEDDNGGFFRLVLGEAAAPIAGFLDSIGPSGIGTPQFDRDFAPIPPAAPMGVGMGSPYGSLDTGFGGFTQVLNQHRAARAAQTQRAQATQPGGGSGATDPQAAFVQSLAPIVKGVASNVSPELILAIAAHESGWGGSNLYKTQNNPFGVKDLKDPSGWARYATLEDAVVGLVKLLHGAQRYASAVGAGQDINAFPRALADAGYIQPLPDGNPDYAWAQRITAIAQQIQQIQQAAQQPQAQTGAAVAPTSAGAYRINVPYGKPYTEPLRDPQGRVTVTHHQGVDLVRDDLPDHGRGSTVTPFVAGTVVHITRNGHNSGNGVAIRDAQGATHWYFHLDAVNVAEGQPVDLTTPIGTLGATGIDLNKPVEGGPHLHYEVRAGGKAVDPRPYMQGGR